jgi:hypothetical protein
MRKWAYEIHSCFLMPGSPLELPNLEAQVCRCLQESYGKTGLSTILLIDFLRPPGSPDLFMEGKSGTKEKI